MSTDSQERRSPRLLDQVRELIRIRRYGTRTEQAYGQWITRLILFHDKRHPLEFGAGEVAAAAAPPGTTRSTSIADAATINSITAQDDSPGLLNSSLTPSEYPC